MTTRAAWWTCLTSRAIASATVLLPAAIWLLAPRDDAGVAPRWTTCAIVLTGAVCAVLAATAARWITRAPFVVAVSGWSTVGGVELVADGLGDGTVGIGGGLVGLVALIGVVGSTAVALVTPVEPGRTGFRLRRREPGPGRPTSPRA